MNNHRKNNSYRIKNIILNYIRKHKNIFNSTYNIFYRVNTGGDIRR